MREFLGIILTVVLTIVASAVDDRLKKRKRRKLAAAYQRDFADDEETVNDTVGLPPVPPAIPAVKPVLPEEGYGSHGMNRFRFRMLWKSLRVMKQRSGASTLPHGAKP